jgi:hypothetical protein
MNYTRLAVHSKYSELNCDVLHGVLPKDHPDARYRGAKKHKLTAIKNGQNTNRCPINDILIMEHIADEE